MPDLEERNATRTKLAVILFMIVTFVGSVVWAETTRAAAAAPGTSISP